MDVKSQILGREDHQGNTIYLRVYYNEKNERTSASVYLGLVSEKRKRYLGAVDFMQHIFYCKRSVFEHLHRMSQSFGFNWTILQDEFLCIKKIYLVVDETTVYMFDKQIISEYGSFMNFKTEGFELQRFVPFDIIKVKAQTFPYGNQQGHQE